MTPLGYLASLALLLILGILVTYLSYKIKIPNVILLILLGVALSYVPNPFNLSEPLISFDHTFLLTMGIFSLAIIVFESSSHFSFKEVDSVSSKALRITLVFTTLTLIGLTLAGKLFFPNRGWVSLMIFAAAMCGTSPDVVLSSFKKNTNNIIKTLQVESIVNTPINVLLPFIIIDFITAPEIADSRAALIPLFGQAILMKIITGIGTGVLFGFILLRILKKNGKKKIAPVILLAMALLTYVVAEALEGNGVLAVTVLGLIFGNSFLKRKTSIKNFSSTLSLSLEILIFILIGFLIRVPLDLVFFVKTVALFGIYILLRWIAILISLRKGKETAKEKLFLALNAPKGIAVAVVAFVLSVSNVPEISFSLDLIFSFILLSVIVSTIITRFSDKFIDGKVEINNL